MTLRKITIDNSVRFVSKADSLKLETLPKEVKSPGNPRKQNWKLRQKKKLFEKITGEGFKVFKWWIKTDTLN